MAPELAVDPIPLTPWRQVEEQMKKIQSDLPNLATDLVAPSSSVPLMRLHHNLAGVIPDPKQAHVQGKN